MNKDSVQIVINRDASNKPFAKVFYNMENPYEMDEETKNFACYMARKCHSINEGIVLINTISNEVIAKDDVDPRKNFDYCMAGSASGKRNCMDLIITAHTGATNLDIEADIVITDGNGCYLDISNKDFTDEQWNGILSLVSENKKEKSRTY